MMPLVRSLLVAGLVSSCANAFSVSVESATRPPATTAAPTLGTSVVEMESPHKPSSLWRSIVPGLMDNPRGLDVSVEWTSCPGTDIAAACDDAARRWMNQAHKRDPFAEDNLSHAMQAYVSFCHEHLNDNNLQFKARIYSARGSAAAAKCPNWHVDHVPVRWIQSFVGPGCQYVVPSSPEQVQELVQANKNKNDAPPQAVQVQEGQGVLVLGKTWPGPETPVWHRSPQGLQPWQGRVLFTMDVEQE